MWLYQLWWQGGQDPNKMTARKIWDLPVHIHSWMSFVLCSAEVAVYSTPVLEEGGTDK
jgi:hypothetical protein